RSSGKGFGLRNRSEIMRCGDCNKFVAYDTEIDPEEEGEPTIEGNHTDGYTFTASYRRVLPCAECGSDLKEATFEINQDVEIPDECPKGEDGAHAFDSVECSVAPSSRTETKDRNGKPIKSARYMKTFYGVDGEFSAKCSH